MYLSIPHWGNSWNNCGEKILYLSQNCQNEYFFQHRRIIRQCCEKITHFENILGKIQISPKFSHELSQCIHIHCDIRLCIYSNKSAFRQTGRNIKTVND